jgi:hypothetical protein
MPLVGIADDNEYQIRCDAGHVSAVFLDNLKFELLFEMGLHALVDDYSREAVSSFAASLERFYEFYWHVVATKFSIPEAELELAWKIVARQSERQLGMFIAAHVLLMKRSPLVLSSKEVKFRNDVIHGGYIPTTKEAIDFGNKIMSLMRKLVQDLRQEVPEALTFAYERLSRHRKIPDEEIAGTMNVLTAIDVRHPPERNDDPRIGDVESQFTRITEDRQPRKLELLSREELKKRFPKSPALK